MCRAEPRVQLRRYRTLEPAIVELGRWLTWAMCGSFLLVAVVLALLPGPDFAAVAKNTLAGGRLRAWSRAVGVTCSNAVQGVAVATGLGAVCVQPLFEAIKWAGIPTWPFRRCGQRQPGGTSHSALVATRQAHEQLLNSYETERNPVAKTMLRGSDRGLRP